MLLESTYLSVFVLNPVAVETLAPERTLRVLGIVALLSAGEASKLVRAWEARGVGGTAGDAFTFPLHNPQQIRCSEDL